jgi:hypothetical protein
MCLQYRDGGRGRGFYGALEEIEEGMEEEVSFVYYVACKYRAYQYHLETETVKNRTKRDVAVAVCSFVAQMKAPTLVLFLKK